MVREDEIGRSCVRNRNYGPVGPMATPDYLAKEAFPRSISSQQSAAVLGF
jgi:hypothetical protein